MNLDYFIFRPIQITDLDALYQLTLLSQAGLTNLPKDKKKLSLIIKKSEQSLCDSQQDLFKKHYMFLVENSLTKEIVATCGLVASMGAHHPSVLMELKYLNNCQKTDKPLQVFKLKTIKKGPSLLISMFISPSFRKLGIGRMVSLSRFLFIHAHADRFQSRIAAELRGYHQYNRSPFWEEALQAFFPMSYQEANQKMLKDTGFISHYFPNKLIFQALPSHIQNILGKTHPSTLGAQKILLSEGFKVKSAYCLLDGGPFLEAPLDQVKCFQNIATFQDCSMLPLLNPQDSLIVCSGKASEFKAIYIKNRSQIKTVSAQHPYLSELIKKENPLFLPLKNKKSFPQEFYTKQLEFPPKKQHAS